MRTDAAVRLSAIGGAGRGAAVLALIAGCLAAVAGSPAAPRAPLQTVADMPLGGNTTRLDYESIDEGRQLLFIAHLGDSAVIVFDTQAQRVITRIPGISKVHGVLAIPELSTVYASATGTNEVVAISEETLKVTARASGGVYPDGMAYAPEVHKLYVSDEHGDTETVIDVRTNTRVATIPLGGDVGNSQYDPGSKHVFVNVQTRRQLVEIDPVSDKVVTRTDLHYVYVAAESGPVSVFKTLSGQVLKVDSVEIGPNAHVVAVDPGTHKSYFPLKNVGGQTVMRIMSPAPVNQ